MKNIIISFLIGYILAWINHGRLIKRLKDTYFYVTKRGYSLAAAWHWAGRVL